MKKYFRKEKFISSSGMMLAVFFAIMAVFIMSPGFARAEDKAALECYKETAKTVVHATAAGLGEVLKSVKTEKERVNMIRSFIKPIRFYSDKSGYFYVYDFSCLNIAHATQNDLPGKTLYDHKDVKGKFVIRELSAAAKKGGGYVEFYWVKPGSKNEFKKLGYVEPIPGTNYFIGTGVYLP
ncbi:MAG: cache domain-containing protein [Deltaproteobacteria bacterium]|nr:cache domain-containing protein [Deltaproteobacteria bacterium]